MAIRLKVQDTTGVTLKVGGTDTARLSAESGIPLYPDEYAGAYSVTPTEAEQTLQTEGLMMTDDVTVGAIDAEYVGSEVPRRTSLNVSGLTVTAPSGYYANALSETVVPVLEDVTKSYMPTETAQSETFTAGTGYDGIGEVSVTVNAIQTETKSATPSESAQSITPTSGKYLTEVSVGAISSTYVGSGIDRRDETDLSASGATVTVPAGYYAEQETKIIPNGAVVVETQAPKKEHGTYIIETTVDQSAGYIESNHVSEQTPLSLENKTATPSGVQQVITPTNKKCYLDSVTVDPIPSQYIVPSGTKQITANGTGIDVKAYEYADVAVPASAPTLQTKSKTYTPTTSQQTEAVTSDGGYDGLDTVNVTVNAMPSGSEGTPTATKGAVSGHAVSVTPSVTNSAGYIPGGTHTGTAVSVSASELVSGTYTVDSSGTKDVTNYATASVPSGTAGTPSATKGAVSNHSISVTPSVTNTTGWITGSTKTGTGVTVTASELVSGSQTLSDNGDYDVTNLASVTVSVSGGGGGNLTVATATKTLTSAASTISFTGLSGNPTSFVVTSSADQSTGGTKVVSVVYDGTSCHGMDITTQAEADTGFTQSYSSGTLTITAATASFQANEYKLVYTYGGSSSDIHTADVQVGSGATSITFSSLSGKPAYFSCVFKSTFSTSSGYQRVIDVVNDGTNTYGHAMDSSAKAQTSWSYSYSGGSLTITSTGTNNGGYFHQPGYYQLTYAVDSNAPQYESISKTYRASTSAQSETITPSSGYDAIEEVSISIPAVSQTNLTAENIKSGTTISISNGQSNLWSVTGSYTGGGGGTLTVATKTTTLNATSQTLTFSSLSGQPKYWFLRATTNVSSSGSTTYYYVTDCFYDGTNIKGNCFRIGSTRRVQNITSGISQSYSGGTLTITAGSSSGATPGQFYGTSNFGYELVYVY